ncbi:flagellar hook-length control protein FliK [Ideonella sp. 4Y11]|uniref:Flagellar hook-length control protein FliK n=1 Tax=Ideonella aquatica TaxID=2824119 RepID=A0A940YGT5_9BURK|nr:flagellar hook-length control protein FliK [Ideonella aquatica]MBQ0958457.1 flagellar hook-length control protein FliK [Ideonella aquatica]
MSQASIAHTPAHRSPSTAGARPPSGAASGPGGNAPAGLFALLLRGQQGDTEATPAAPPGPEAGAQDAPQDEDGDRSETTAAPAGDPSPAPASVPTPVPAWTPTVRTATAAEPSAETEGGDALQRLGATGRSRASAARDALERSTAPDESQQTPATERPVAELREAGQRPATDPMTEAPLTPAGPEPVPETAPIHAVAGTLPSLGGASDTAAATPAPAEPAPTARAHLPQPPTSPAFAPALGLQISTWLREGVQHAALELNPAELGPIDVRIALRDGQAQVALAADVPFTRQALADALPQLAEALGDVGVQLAGGDVSDQAGRRARDESAAGPHGGAAALPGGAEPAPAPVPAAARRRGLLDLYA